MKVNKKPLRTFSFPIIFCSPPPPPARMTSRPSRRWVREASRLTSPHWPSPLPELQTRTCPFPTHRLWTSPAPLQSSRPCLRPLQEPQALRLEQEIYPGLGAWLREKICTVRVYLKEKPSERERVSAQQDLRAWVPAYPHHRPPPRWSWSSRAPSQAPCHLVDIGHGGTPSLFLLPHHGERGSLTASPTTTERACLILRRAPGWAQGKTDL